MDMDETLSRNELARAIATTTSLDQVETFSREVCGYSEIDYERNKAAWLKEQPPTELNPKAVLAELDHFEASARSRGVTHTTFRHITEALHLNGNQRQDLRELLLNSRPEQYDAPLWRITTTSEQQPSSRVQAPAALRSAGRASRLRSARRSCLRPAPRALRRRAPTCG
ncbi:hypothetical protein GCM10010121_085990 [Streptomyces brasiliensis]|uniref:Uncharacterized protein n=1 Tax=Streptomyces brasiliensis TaxID=1954 RepID=A0A917UJE8_9ACTN|nr:hypothetical protein GCM10010121_085990 [Streptomyces brasiliensis]